MHNGEEKTVTVTLGEQTKEYRRSTGIASEEAGDETDRNADEEADREADGDSGISDEHDDRGFDDIWNSLGE